MERSKEIFGNKISKKTYKKAIKSKNKFLKKFGNDSNNNYHLGFSKNKVIGDKFNLYDLSFSDETLALENNPIIIGNIRMGFGHYRISIAMASCAKALGYTPYWLDLNSFDSTGSKMIKYQNELYTLGSKISSKSKLFNHFVWEPINKENFRRLSYNAIDQKNSELLTPILKGLPKDVPYIATHVWPAQAAIHNNMTHVVNAIPDNWPMALHLAEGSIHTVQTPFAYLGYKSLNGMSKEELKPMPDNTLFNVGHYIDHELVSNLDEDTKKRTSRLNNNDTLRFILTVGGAGAQQKMFEEIISYLLPYVKNKKVKLFINFGDHFDFYNNLYKNNKELDTLSEKFIDKYNDLEEAILNEDFKDGIVSICNNDIFEAVYSTNLLMRISDLLITKPSELAYYPIPKLMIKRVGGHEAYGAIHSSEIGDGTYELETTKDITRMLKLIIEDKEVLLNFNKQILNQKENGLYDGGYKAVKLAASLKLE